MEKPDANGFVNIRWPSKSVPHGGIFHTRVVQQSSSDREFLKLLLEESKLSITQRQKSGSQSKPVNKEDVHSYKPPAVRPRTSRRRSLSAIRQSGDLEMDGYRPLKRGEDRELLKERLAHTMAYGTGDEEQKAPLASRVKPIQAPKLPTNKDKWNDLVTQIRERAEWLAEMEELGEAGPHREMIKDQIANRLRALDALGIDSVCSSARSNKSGFSVMDDNPESQRSNRSAVKSDVSDIPKAPNKNKRINRRQLKEENVMSYNKLPILQYSPRRRV